MVINLGNAYRKPCIGIIVPLEIHIEFALLLAADLKAVLGKREIILVLFNPVPVKYFSKIIAVGVIFDFIKKIISVRHGHIDRVKNTTSFDVHSAEMLNIKLHSDKIKKLLCKRE